MKIRYEEFDSIRGIAALTVLFHHCLIVFPSIYLAHKHQEQSSQILKVITYSPLHFFWAGHEAVILFFVLSGFVLYLSISNSKAFVYKEYVIKRLCRIYLPYLFVMIISILLYNFYGYFNLINKDYLNTSDWFNRMWSENLDIKTIISVIFMLGFQTHNLNTVTWSLIHELRISFFFPLIVFFINKNNVKYPFRKIFILIVSAWLILVYSANLISNRNIQYFLLSFGSTFYYAIFFIIGCLLAKNIFNFKIFFANKNLFTKNILIFVCFIFYLNEWFFPFFSELRYSSSFTLSNLSNTAIDLLTGCSVFIFFSILVSSEKIKEVLKNRYFLFLGQISFSLYLIHPIVLMSIINLFSDYVYLPILIMFSIFFSIFLSYYLYRYVELTSISIGKKIISKRKKTRVA